MGKELRYNAGPDGRSPILDLWDGRKSFPVRINRAVDCHYLDPINLVWVGGCDTQSVIRRLPPTSLQG
jgi:hypothetical protein